MTSPGRYAGVHKDPQGAGYARPTALQIIRDEGVEGKPADKVVTSLVHHQVLVSRLTVP